MIKNRSFLGPPMGTPGTPKKGKKGPKRGGSQGVLRGGKKEAMFSLGFLHENRQGGFLDPPLDPLRTPLQDPPGEPLRQITHF